MDRGSISRYPRTVEEVFKDFKDRRAGILQALTSELEEFFKQFDPDKEALCLYGLPDKDWEVNLPAEDVPPELPEPANGINFVRDSMQRDDWLSLVATHSDAWLLAVSYFYGSRLDKKERKRLFNMINGLPTVLDVVTGKKPVERKPSANNTGRKKLGPAGSKLPRAVEQPEQLKPPPPPKEEEEALAEEQDDTDCGICGENYIAGEFWIGCDSCEKWFHGECVNITAAQAEHFEHYECPSCSSKMARTSQTEL